MNDAMYHVILIGIATGAISLFISKSALLNSFHKWLEARSLFLENMLSCPWCTSHWVGAFFLLVYQPRLIGSGNLLLTPIDWLVTLMVVVTIAAITAGIIYGAYRPIMG
jgi:hypothetical protein